MKRAQGLMGLVVLVGIAGATLTQHNDMAARSASPVRAPHMSAAAGAIVRTVTVGPHPFVMAVDGRSSRVFVTSLGAMDAAGHLTGPGSVSVLDAQSGMLLRTVPVGVEPAVIAVDERAGRAFVVNVAGDSHDTLAAARSLVPGLPRPPPPCNSYGRGSTRCRFAPGSVTVLDATR